MYTEFFQLNAVPINQLNGVYDLKLVLLSFIVASMASYVALDLTGRLRDHNNSKKETLFWLIGGCIAMGAGIWSMHFIGMLSFSIPNFVLEYDWFWTIFSLFVAIMASFFALFLLKRSIINLVHFIGGGVILGLAIASMHYTGMTAMLISLNISYLPSLFTLSILVAIVASIAAIWLALKSTTVVSKLRTRIKILSALTMGFAICGMHYTAMAASVFSPLCTPVAVSASRGLDQAVLATIIAIVTIIILGIAFLTSSHKEAKNQLQFEKARQLGMAEISASVLHNVGNVLNSVNVSIETLIASLASSPLKEIKKLVDLLNQHQDDLGDFMTKDPHGKHVVPYINELAKCLTKEHELGEQELKEISKNVGLIKNIISTQQSVIKVDSYEEVIEVNKLIDEVLILSGINLKNQIQVFKEYGSINPILVDKIKLLQILGNLITNAKDSLLESSNPEKILKVTTQLVKDKISIQVCDNGVGISKSNLNKIFIFGFTTKKSGHGFGLHASALAVNDLGGKITVESDGPQQGATVTIYLPNRKASLLKKR